MSESAARLVGESSTMRTLRTGTISILLHAPGPDSMLGFAAMARATTVLMLLLAALAAPAGAQTVQRISTPAVPDDWHVKMLYVFRDELAKTAPRLEVQVHHSGTLFRQGAEVVAMQ